MTKLFFTPEEKAKIKQAIAQAEKQTSGEIRVHLESTCAEEVLDRAAFIFEELDMHETAQRNGVLFYLSYEDKKFAILGDAGINKVVAPNFWDQIRDELRASFAQGRFAEGLIKGITAAGAQLQQHFPYRRSDENELSNDVSYGQ